jgi:DtxR family Mn-dependent transcriptional regulator
MWSHAVEDYLKAIFELEDETGRAATSALAERLKVSPASVTGMVQKLAESRPRLVNYERHQGVTLTAAGRRIALEVIRHHRLIELYLQEALGYPWDQVHAEAEKLEHAISEEFEDRICAALGNPTIDPHGDPIPAKDGAIAVSSRVKLSQMEAGQSGRVARVRDEDPALLRYLAELGLVPNASLSIEARAPFEGPLHVLVEGAPPAHALGRSVTDQVFVEVHPSEKE